MGAEHGEFFREPAEGLNQHVESAIGEQPIKAADAMQDMLSGLAIDPLVIDDRLIGSGTIGVGTNEQVTFGNSTNSTAQLSTVPAMRGRVMALRVASALAGTPIGAPIAGWVANRFRPSPGDRYWRRGGLRRRAGRSLRPGPPKGATARPVISPDGSSRSLIAGC